MENQNNIGATTNKINVENVFVKIEKIIPNDKNELIEIFNKLEKFVIENFNNLYSGAVRNSDFRTTFDEEFNQLVIAANFKKNYYYFRERDGIINFSDFCLDVSYEHYPNDEQLLNLVEFINFLIGLINKPVLSKIKISFE